MDVHANKMRHLGSVYGNNCVWTHYLRTENLRGVLLDLDRQEVELLIKGRNRLIDRTHDVNMKLC